MRPMHPMHAMILSNTAAELFVAIQAKESSSEAQDMEQSARLALHLVRSARRASGSRFIHPAEEMGLMRSATKLLAGKIANVEFLDAAKEEALVEDSVKQAVSLDSVIRAARRNEYKTQARREAQPDDPVLPSGVRIEEETPSPSTSRPSP